MNLHKGLGALGLIVLLNLNALACGAGSSAYGQNMRVSEIAELAVQHAESEENDASKARALSVIAKIFAANGERAEAKALFDKALGLPADNLPFDEISWDQADAGFFEDALKTTARVSHDEGSDVCYSSIAQSMVEQGQVEQVDSVLAKINEDWWKTLTLAFISASLTKQGKQDVADRYWKRTLTTIQGIKNRDASIAAAVSAAEELAVTNRDRAMELAAIADDKAKTKSEYWDVLRAYVACGDVTKTRQIIERLKKLENDSGSPASDLTYKVFEADVLVRAGKLTEAQAALEKIRSYEYYCVTAESLAAEWTARGEFTNALDVIKTIDVVKDGNVHVRSMLGVLEKLLKPEIRKRFEGDDPKRMLDKCCQLIAHLDDDPYGYYFELLGQTYGRLQLDSDLEEWVKTLESPFSKSMALAGLASGLLDAMEQ